MCTSWKRSATVARYADDHFPHPSAAKRSRPLIRECCLAWPIRAKAFVRHELDGRYLLPGGVDCAP